MTQILAIRGRTLATFMCLALSTFAVAWAAAPRAPSALRVDNVFRDAADLKWCDNSSNETQFRIALNNGNRRAQFVRSVGSEALDFAERLFESFNHRVDRKR